jgi:hypothetical protein
MAKNPQKQKRTFFPQLGLLKCKFKKCNQTFTDPMKYGLHCKIQCLFKKRRPTFKTRAALTPNFNWGLLPIGNCLGSGGYGQVWEGKLKDQLFAVKIS